MSEISEKLLPCPFCKDEMESFAGLNEGAFARGSDGTFAVNCDCGAMGPAKPTMAEAVTAWNHRAAHARAEAVGVKLLERFVRVFQTGYSRDAFARRDYDDVAADAAIFLQRHRKQGDALAHPAVPEGMYGEYTPVTVGTGTADVTLSARVAQLEEALGHDQWSVINRAIDRYNAGEISDLHALGLIATGFMALDKARLSALSEKDAR